MRIEDVDLACDLKYRLDQLQAVKHEIESTDYPEIAMYISIYNNGERKQIPKETAKKIINIIISDIEAIKHDIEAL